MAAARMWLLAALFGAAGTSVVKAVTPVQKVFQLMKEMKQTCIADQESEATRYSSFKQFCNNTDAAKVDSIDRATRTIEKLEADIAKAEADIETMDARVAELQDDVTRWGKDVKAVTEIRKNEQADYVATRDEYVNAVAVCDRAVGLLRSLAHKETSKKEALVVHKVKVATRALLNSTAVLKADANSTAFDADMRASVREYKAQRLGVEQQRQQQARQQQAKAQARAQAKRARRALVAALDAAAGQVGVADEPGALASTLPKPWWRREHATAASGSVEGPVATPAARQQKRAMASWFCTRLHAASTLKCSSGVARCCAVIGSSSESRGAGTLALAGSITERASFARSLSFGKHSPYWGGMSMQWV